MNNIKVARIHTDLVDAFRVVGRQFASKIKKEYNLSELYISDIMASQLVGGQMKGKKVFNIKIKRINGNRGILEIL